MLTPTTTITGDKELDRILKDLGQNALKDSVIKRGLVKISKPIIKDIRNNINNVTKKLSKSTRETLAKYIKKNSIWAIGKASVKEIEKINIFHASMLAMKRAIIKLKKKPSLVLIDGNKSPNIKNYNFICVIKGDQKIPSISAASIIAKVTRDKMISNLGKKFIGYYWDKNCGYGTKEHLKGIKHLGITCHPRKTFSPINKIK